MKQTSLSRGTVFITLSTIVFVVSSYSINIWLGRYLGPDAYGIYGLIISLLTAINLTQTSGLPLAIAKYTAEDANQAEALLHVGLITQIISTIFASVLIFLLAPFLAQIFKDTSLTPYIRLSAAVFPLYGIYSVYLNYYNGLHFFKEQAFMNITYSLAKLFSIIIFVYFFHVYGAIFGFIIAPLIALMFWLHIPKNTGISFPYKKLILFSLPLIVMAIFSNLLQSIDLFFVKRFLHQNYYSGLYTANQNIAEMPFYGITALASVLFPGIARSTKQALHEQTNMLIKTALRFTLLIITPSSLLISATSLQILEFLYSSGFLQGAMSLSLLAIASGFFTFFVILTTIITGSGSPWKSAFLAGLGLVLCAVCCQIFVPLFGIQGASFATLLASLTVTVYAAIIVYKKFHVLFSLHSFLRILIASFVMYVLARIVILPTLLLPFWYVILFGIYTVVLYMLGEIRKEDIKHIHSLLPVWAVEKIKL